MSKAKIRSMQRGAQKRSSEAPILMKDIYQKHPPQLSQMDIVHLSFTKYRKTERVAQIEKVIRAAKKNGIGTASEISRLLNKIRVRTAIDEPWTPRLAWFAAEAVKDVSEDSEHNAKHASSYRHDKKFDDLVRRAVKSRLDEIRLEFNASKPTIGDALPELRDIKRRLETRG